MVPEKLTVTYVRVEYIYLKSILRSYSTLCMDIPHQDIGEIVYGGADLVTPSARGNGTVDNCWTSCVYNEPGKCFSPE